LITFRNYGNFDRTERYLKRLKLKNFRPIVERYARQGVEVLGSNTPKDSGVSADSWGFRIAQTKDGFYIAWTNNNVTPGGTPIVILLQYGHGTRGGTYVAGQDFINPVMKPLFEQLSHDLWKEVSRL